MPQTIRSQSGFVSTTPTFDHLPLVRVGSYQAASTTVPTGCIVIEVGHEAPIEEALPNHVSLEDLERSLSEIPGFDDEIVEARKWASTYLYPDGITLQKLRLQRGLTQAMLAKAIGTSQPHLARIEKGNGDLMCDTMRKLCEALDVDMNTLDQALRAATDE